MIIGMDDRERVRKLEIENKLARDLIRVLRDDMEEIALYLRNEKGLDTAMDGPLYKLWHDIGRCIGRLDSSK